MRYRACGDQLSDFLSGLWAGVSREEAAEKLKWVKTTPYFRRELERLRNELQGTSEEEIEAMAFFSTVRHDLNCATNCVTNCFM